MKRDWRLCLNYVADKGGGAEKMAKEPYWA